MADYYYPAIEKTFSLEDLSIPPERYAKFLSYCVDPFIESVLENYKSKTISEALEKNKEQVKKLNIGKTEEELQILKNPLIEIFIRGELKFLKHSKVKNKKIYREISESEKLLKEDSDVYGISISINQYKKELIKYVDDFKKALDKKYPNRKNKIIGGIESVFNSHLPYKFELNLFLRSIPTICLETNIVLCNNGSVIPGDRKNLEKYFIPGIKIKTSLLKSSLDIPKKIVNRLEEVAKKCYNLRNEVSHQISYS